MIENKEIDITKDDTTHPDLMYAVTLAININMAVGQINSGNVDERTSAALSSSMQIPNVVSLAAALIVCIRPLFMDGTIDFRTAVKKMHKEREGLNSQMELDETIAWIESALDLDKSESSIILDS